MKENTIKEFQALSSLKDLAYFLNISPKKLSYILYKLNNGPNGQYIEFSIKKRNGSDRVISTPNTALKEVQKKLATKLSDIYMAKKSVHGFIRNRNIITNAHQHSNQRYVFHIDLKDFFPSIHFGRIMGLFQAKPYELKRDISILIAKIACHNDCLPQGSPCSPIISNMICAHLDSQLVNLAKNTGCYYTRYADDITFSTNKSDFPDEIGFFNGEKWIPGKALSDIIDKHNFGINHDKTSIRTRSDRQLVTGVVVNNYPNIQRRQLKQVRAMLHDWKENGLESAHENYVKKYYLGNRKDTDLNISFANLVRGKLEHIRHIRTHRITTLNNLDKKEAIRKRLVYRKKELQTIHKDQYYKYFQRFEQLTIRDCGLPTILGEGETDWIHLRAALRHFNKHKAYTGPKLNIHKHKKYALSGYKPLSDFCKNAYKHYVKFTQPVICIFDSDIPKVNEDHKASKNGYLSHGNNVYSFVLPKPEHVKADSFAIEQLYKDDDLLKKDKNGRRLFLSTEFNHKTQLHKDNNAVRYGIRAKDGRCVAELKKKDTETAKILDRHVCEDQQGTLKSIALTKMSFATNIMRNVSPFNEPDFSSFTEVFDLIKKICENEG